MYLSQRVVLLDKAPQPLLDNVGVNLRGRDIGMAEELLHRRTHGIPLHREVIDWFGECTREMGLPPLEA